MAKLRDKAIEVITDWIDNQSDLQEGQKTFYKEELRGYEAWFGEATLLNLAGFLVKVQKTSSPKSFINYVLTQDIGRIGVIPKSMIKDSCSIYLKSFICENE